MKYYPTWKDPNGNVILFPGDAFNSEEKAIDHRFRVFFTYMATMRLIFDRILPVADGNVVHAEVLLGPITACCISGPLFEEAKLEQPTTTGETE